MYINRQKIRNVNFSPVCFHSQLILLGSLNAPLFPVMRVSSEKAAIADLYMYSGSACNMEATV